MSQNPPVSLDERIRRYLLKMEAPRRDPSDPQDSHTIVFNAARALLHGFGLSVDQARPFLEEYLQRSDAPWAPAEIEHKLRSVDSQPAKANRGYLLASGDASSLPETAARPGSQWKKAPEVAFDAEKLRRIAGQWRDVVDLRWLADRSAADPALVSSGDFLKGLYAPDEKVLVFTSEFSRAGEVWPGCDLPKGGPCGVWFLPQPVDGEWRANPEGRPTAKGEVPMSRRTWRNVTAFRYLVIESDEADARDWLGMIVQVPLRIEALYTSGGRSVHALVRVDCRTKNEWDAYKAKLGPFLTGARILGADRGTWSAVRLTRLPGAYRHGKMIPERDANGDPVKDDRGRVRKRLATYPVPHLQKLLYYRPGADVRPIVEIAAERDVERTWLDLAALGIADSDETNGATLLRALRYYENVSPLCKVERVRLEDYLRHG